MNFLIRESEKKYKKFSEKIYGNYDKKQWLKVLITASIIQKEVELEVSEKTLIGDNPVIMRIRFELQSLKNKYNNFIHNNSIESLIPNFDEVPQLQLKLIKLQRQAEYYSRIIEFLGPAYEQQKFEEAKNIPTLQILDYAVRPDLKTKPKRAIIVIVVFLLSSIFAITYALVKESKILSNK